MTLRLYYKRRSYPYNDDDADYIVGLDKDIKMLLEVLLGEGKTQVHVVSIKILLSIPLPMMDLT